jgi:osmotically-inducible protein OsmY/sporulation protein YlmC with PRC-barrel domain
MGLPTADHTKTLTKNSNHYMKSLIKYGSVALVGLIIPVVSIQAEDHIDKDKAADKNRHAMRHASKASDIIGMEVRNLQDEKLGKIEDLVIDLQGGGISYAILSSGGVLGIGDKLVPVPASRFSYASSEKQLILDTDKKTLEGAMPFTKGEWPDLSNPEWDAPYRTYYQGTSLAGSGQTQTDTFAFRQTAKDGERTPADPARRVPGAQTDQNLNRDLGVTPQDQGGSEIERTTTANIRKALMDNKALSFTAKNVKVITANGTITLRGSVPTQREKEEIVAVTKKHAGSHTVSDQIEIKPD